MAVGDLYELAIRGRCLQQPIFNVFHYQVSNQAGGAPTLAQINAAFQTKVQASLLALSNQLYTLVEIACQLRVPNGANFQAPRGRLDILASGGVGAGTSDVLPLQCACYVRLYAEISPSSYLRGGKFFGALNEGSVTNGKLTAGAVTAFQTLCGKLLETLTMGTGGGTILVPVIYSPKRHRFGPNPYIVQISSYTINQTMKTIRRRVEGTTVGGY